MVKFYEKEVERARKKIEYALVGFMAELDICSEKIATHDDIIAKRQAINELNEAVEVIQEMFSTLDINVRSLAHAHREQKQRTQDANANIYDHLREETVDSLCKDKEVAEC